MLNSLSHKHQKLLFKTNYHLMKVESIAECSKGSILHYFQPSLSYHLSLRSLFCLFLSGHSQKDLKLVFKTNYRLMQVKSICNILSTFIKLPFVIKVFVLSIFEWPISKRPKIGFQDQLSLNAGQKYCRMLQGEHSAILSTFIKLPFVIKIFVLSIFEWPLSKRPKIGFQDQLSLNAG